MVTLIKDSTMVVDYLKLTFEVLSVSFKHLSIFTAVHLSVGFHYWFSIFEKEILINVH